MALKSRAELFADIDSTLADNSTGAITAAIMRQRLIDMIDSSREKLVAPRTYFVRTDGDDGNDGLSNVAGGAFATIQRAVDVIGSIDIGPHAATIKLGNSGTFSGDVTINGPWVGTGDVTLEGDVAAPENTIVTSALDTVTVQNGGRLSVGAFTAASAGGPNHSAIRASSNGVVRLKTGMRFGAAGWAHLYALTGGVITNDAMAVAYTISGGGRKHWAAHTGGAIAIQLATITLTGTPAFSDAFAEAKNVGSMIVNANVFSGAATGKRYDVATNGAIGGSSDENYLPGNAAGTKATGGQYSA